MASASRRVLGVGRFDKCKGFDYLVRAIHELDRLGIDVELELIGDGEQARLTESLDQRAKCREEDKV